MLYNDTISYELDTWNFNTFYPEARNALQGQQRVTIFPLLTHCCYEIYKNYISSHYISFFFLHEPVLTLLTQWLISTATSSMQPVCG
jgi:hypothetical protein